MNIETFKKLYKDEEIDSLYSESIICENYKITVADREPWSNDLGSDKYQSQQSVYKVENVYDQTSIYYAVIEYRTGSYYTEYDRSEDPEIYQVQPKEITIIKWEVV